jgi:hypothetical protein
LCRENDTGRLRSGDIGDRAKRFTGGYLFLRISGGSSVNFEDTERLEHARYLLNRIREKKNGSQF